MRPTIWRGRLLILLAILVVLAVFNRTGWLPTWVAWSFATLAGLSMLLFPPRGKVLPESVKVEVPVDVREEHRASMSPLGAEASILGEQEPLTESDETFLQAKVETLMAEVERLQQQVDQRLTSLTQHGEELDLRLDLILIQGDEQAKRAEQLATFGAGFLGRMEALFEQNRVVTEVVQRLIDNSMGLVDQVALLTERVDQVVLLPTEPPPAEAVSPPPAAAPRGPVPPVPVQVTSYQNGQPPTQRQVNLRIGGRFF